MYTYILHPSHFNAWAGEHVWDIALLDPMRFVLFFWYLALLNWHWSRLWTSTGMMQRN